MTEDVFRLIAQAQAAYASAIDNDRLEDWPGFFADPCRYVITTADNHREGLEAGAGVRQLAWHAAGSRVGAA